MAGEARKSAETTQFPGTPGIILQGLTVPSGGMGFFRTRIINFVFQAQQLTDPREKKMVTGLLSFLLPLLLIPCTRCHSPAADTAPLKSGISMGAEMDSCAWELLTAVWF